MLIPFGVLSAAGADVGPVFEDAFELIATAFGTGSSGTITFSSIPATYKHLEIRYAVKNTTTGTRDLAFRLNGITTSSYNCHQLLGTGTSTSSDVTGASNTIRIPSGLADSATANIVSPGVIQIMDYASTSKNTTLRGLYGQTGGVNRVGIFSGALFDTQAITSVSAIISSGQFTTSSRISLYGIKG